MTARKVRSVHCAIIALYRLTMNAPPHNLWPIYNVCPTDSVDVVVADDTERELVEMRWVDPRWWSKSLKELRAATFKCARGKCRNQAFLPRCVQAHALLDPALELF
jgi:putative SOS response-associated peptidase YedK